MVISAYHKEKQTGNLLKINYLFDLNQYLLKEKPETSFPIYLTENSE